MDFELANSWTYRGLQLVVEWQESVFRFRVLRMGSEVEVASGFARSLEAARDRAQRAANAAVTGALPLS